MSLLKRDLNVRITQGEVYDMLFAEEWARDFPAKDGRKILYQLWYGATPVQAFYFVTVDGRSAELPFPKIGTMKITPCNWRWQGW